MAGSARRRRRPLRERGQAHPRRPAPEGALPARGRRPRGGSQGRERARPRPGEGRACRWREFVREVTAEVAERRLPVVGRGGTVKIVAIAGSPRKNGNSTALMRLAVEGATGARRHRRGLLRQGDERRRLPGLRFLQAHGRRGSACRRTTCMPCTPPSGERRVAPGEPRLLLRPHLVDQAVVDRCYALMPFEGVPEGEQPVPRIAPGKGCT